MIRWRNARRLVVRRWNECCHLPGPEQRSGADRRVSGIADRRREIHADLAELYRRRSGECTTTCIHTQDHPVVS